MKIERALLLSSIRQAGSWEGTRYTFFGLPMIAKQYRFLVTDNRVSGKGLLLEISCTHREDVGGKMADVVSPPHVSESFTDLDELHDFQQRFQIDDENWYPIEE